MPIYVMQTDAGNELRVIREPESTTMWLEIWDPAHDDEPMVKIRLRAALTMPLGAFIMSEAAFTRELIATDIERLGLSDG